MVVVKDSGMSIKLFYGTTKTHLKLLFKNKSSNFIHKD